MAFQHGKKTVVLADHYDVTNAFKSASVKRSKKTDESSVFGTTMDRDFLPGSPQNGSMSLAGLFRGDANQVDAILRGSFSNGNAGQLISLFYGGPAIGNRCAIMKSRTARHSVGQSFDSLTPVSAEVTANGGVDQGVSLHSSTAAETASTDGASVDNAASSNKGAAAHLHVLAVSGAGANLVAKVQHSPDNSAWADLITFTAATAVGEERKEVASGVTIDRYTRCSSTITGTTPSFTYALAFCRRGDVDLASVTMDWYPQGVAAGTRRVQEGVLTEIGVECSFDGLMSVTASFQASGARADTVGSVSGFTHGKKGTFTLDNAAGTPVALTSYLTNVDWDDEQKLEDASVFGTDREVNEQGLQQQSVRIQGRWDPAIDKHLADIMG